MNRAPESRSDSRGPFAHEEKRLPEATQVRAVTRGLLGAHGVSVRRDRLAVVRQLLERQARVRVGAVDDDGSAPLDVVLDRLDLGFVRQRLGRAVKCHEWLLSLPRGGLVDVVYETSRPFQGDYLIIITLIVKIVNILTSVGAEANRDGCLAYATIGIHMKEAVGIYG